MTSSRKITLVTESRTMLDVGKHKVIATNLNYCLYNHFLLKHKMVTLCLSVKKIVYNYQ